MGTLDVALKVPVEVTVPAIPSMADVPMVSVFPPPKPTLNRLAVPEKVEVPLNDTCPADAVNDPEAPTEKLEEIDMFLEVDIVPVTLSVLNCSAPAPEMVFPDPDIEIDPPVAVRVPVATRFPAITKELVVDTDPEAIVRSSSTMPEPEMVFEVPVIVNTPVPPVVWVKDPEPVVEKLPHNVIEVF